MPRITPLQVAMAIGTAGAMVDVSSYVKGSPWFTLASGREDEFRDGAPGTFSFTLENQDGRFTPGNTASPLVTQVTEGMSVCLNIGGRLTSGKIMGFDLLQGEQNWGRIQINCDDMLGAAARHLIPTGLASQIVAAASPLYYWPLNEDATAQLAIEQSGNNGAPLQPSANGRYAFGAAAVPVIGETQLQFATVGTPRSFSTTIPLVSGYYGVWITPSSATTGAYMSMTFLNSAVTASVVINSSGQWELDGFGPVIPGPNAVAGVPSYVVMRLVIFTAIPFNFTVGLWVDGVSYGTTFSTSAGSSNVGTLTIGTSASPDTVSFSHLSVATTLVHEELAGSPLESSRLTVLAGLAPELSLATLPTALSLAPIGYPNVSGQSVFDAMNDVVRTEQGEIYTQTTGTLLAPVQQIVVRERDRTTTPLYSFDAFTELDNTPQFVRDITNLVSTVTVQGPDKAVVVADPTAVARAASASAAESVLNENAADLQTWGSDRIYRGKNVALKVASFTVDALTTPTDRSANLLALKPGDRIRITGLPSAQLGFSTWDGHIVGRDELHSIDSHQFTFKVKPALPASAVYDTGATDGNRYMAGGDLSLSSALTNVATSMSVATIGAKLSTTETPYTMIIDSEQITLTAVSAATPQVCTITRGANGTTAAAHSSGALLEMATQALYAF